jgi:microcystin degradation protein MlrC
MKILVGECKQEVSSFNPVSSHYDDFDISQGAELLDFHRGLNTELCGALGVFAERSGLTVVPTYSARARTSGGALARADFARIRREFVEAVRAAPPVDGIYLSLHGAMSAEGEDDPEGALLAELRAILGERLPVVVSLDLHGILTAAILSHCDAIVAYHTYPHIDFAATGERAARLLLRILDGEVQPVTALVPIPALVRGNELITATGLFGRMIRQAQAIEASPGGLSAGMFIGNPFTDVTDLRSNSFVVTDGDPARAQREALALASDFWQVRERLQAPLVPLAAAVAATQATTGTTILTDAADATSSGASGDSNLIVRGLLKAGYEGKVLAPIVDPDAVQAALAAGVGRIVETTVGGKLDTRRFAPLPIRAQVTMLSEGRFRSESNGALWDAGLTAVLAAENVTWVVTSRPVSLYDRSLFYAHGQDPQQFDAVIVKSPHCQPHMFDDWAAQDLNVDVDGSTSANLHRLGHTRCARPIFPLDPEVAFDPQVQLFHRRASQ